MELSEQTLLYTRLKGQYLIEKTDRLSVVRNLCGLQSQFANNPRYALRIRANDFDEDSWADGLVKIWAQRHTLHIVERAEADLYLNIRWVYGAYDDVNLPAVRKAEIAALAEGWIKSGITHREALRKKAEDTGFSQSDMSWAFNGWGGVFSALANRGKIAYRASTAKEFTILEQREPKERFASLAVLRDRYFEHYGPASEEDFLTFFSLMKKDAKELEARWPLKADKARYNGKDVYFRGDLQEGEIPPVLFLAGFDQLIMGYKDRSFLYSASDRNKVVTVSGIVFPLILINGRAGASWSIKKNRLIISAFEKQSKQLRRKIEENAFDRLSPLIKEVIFAE